MLSLDDGKELVKLARNSIDSYFKNENISDDRFKEKKGVFVSLYSSNGELRGCIGFMNIELGKGVIEAARGAAFYDYRFSRLEEDEEYLVEISVLTKPKKIKDKSEIKIGRDGLIIEKNGYKGLLLPQVFKKEGVEEALAMVCRKAGLNDDDWKENCEIYVFQAQIFKEIEKGKVVEK